MKHQPRKRFGQNFLADAQVLARMQAAIGANKQDTLIEIGPGLGALTELLLPNCQRLFAIEIDRDLCTHLRLRFADEPIQLIEQDALSVDFGTLTDTPCRLIGNLPYNISTPLLFHALSCIDHMIDMHFLLQKEVVERICAQPGDSAYGRLSVMIQYCCKPDYLFEVDRTAFKPIPKVDSAFFRLTPHATLPQVATDFSRFEKIVQQCFNHRRKMIRKSLKELVDLNALSDIIDVNLRPEQLSVADFVRISNHV